MPVAIDNSVGGSASNAFVSLAELTAYMTGRLNSSAFDSATTDNQNRAIVEATREISNKSWKGSRASSTQALSWPRQWVQNPDLPYFAASYYATTEIPQRVKDATMELAFQFLVAGTTDIASRDSSLDVQSETVDVISTTYVEPGFRPQGLSKYPRVMDLIRPLLCGSSLSVPVVRG